MLRPIRQALLAASLLLAAGAPALGAGLEVQVDHAHIVKIDEPAETIIIGNPSIVDVAVHDTSTLILTGRSYGITNLIVLGRGGTPIIDASVAVRTFEDQTVRVFRQASRSTYACTPSCQPTVTIGDAAGGFSDANAQFQTRQSMMASGN